MFLEAYVLTKALEFLPFSLGLPKMASDPGCRSRLRQNSTFFVRPGAGVKKNLKNRTQMWSHFSLFAVAVLRVGFTNAIS